jgi:hypothetical protein
LQLEDLSTRQKHSLSDKKKLTTENMPLDATGGNSAIRRVVRETETERETERERELGAAEPVQLRGVDSNHE